MHVKGTLTALALAGASVLVLTGAAAGVAPTSSLAGGAGRFEMTALTTPSTGARPPRGYVVVTTPLLASASGTQQRGTVDCPRGTVPLGGGATVFSTSMRATINSSFPFGRGWAADVNNASGETTAFDVRVVCATRPTGYAVVTSAAT